MRPLTRPPAPYTNKEIFARLEQHFFEERNPQCFRHPEKAGTTASGGCVYGNTGCAVGCLITVEDAEKIDNEGTFVVTEVSRCFPDIFNAYFQRDQLEMLTYLQQWHDYHFSNRERFEEIKRVYL